MAQQIQIPASEWHKVKKMIERISSNSELSNLVNEKEAAELLGIKVITIRNNVSKKKMEGMYTVGAGGKRFYFRSKIMGIDKI